MRNIHELLGFYFDDILSEDIIIEKYTTLEQWAKFNYQIGKITKEEYEELKGNYRFTEGLNNLYKILDKAIER